MRILFWIVSFSPLCSTPRDSGPRYARIIQKRHSFYPWLSNSLLQSTCQSPKLPWVYRTMRMAPVWLIWHASWTKEERMWPTAGSPWGRKPMSPILAPSYPYPGSWEKGAWPSSVWPGTPSAAILQTLSLPGSSVKVTVSPFSLETSVWGPIPSSATGLNVNSPWKLRAPGKSPDWEEGGSCSKSWVTFPSLTLLPSPCLHLFSL